MTLASYTYTQPGLESGQDAGTFTSVANDSISISKFQVLNIKTELHSLNTKRLTFFNNIFI